MACWLSDAKNEVWVHNGIVKAGFLDMGQYIRQLYYALDENSQWTLIAQSAHPLYSSSEGVSPLFVTEGRNRPYRILTHNALRSMRVLEQSEDFVDIQLSGEDHGNQVQQLVSVRSSEDHVHIEVTCTLADVEAPKIEYVLSAFTFTSGRPDWVRAPYLKRAKDHVMVLRSLTGAIENSPRIQMA